MKKVVGMLAVVGLCVLAYWFWPGEEPILPKPSEVRDIRLVQGQEVVQIDQSEEIAVFLAELGNAKRPIKIVFTMHRWFHPMCGLLLSWQKVKPQHLPMKEYLTAIWSFPTLVSTS